MRDEFRNYALKQHGISSLKMDRYTSMTRNYITPYIIEERPMNITQLDVFSRLMKDRIIFMGVGIYDTMQYLKPDVSTICTGMAASMAAVLMCAGAKGKRFALPHSRVMIHQPMGGAQGQASDIEIEAREIQKIKKELYEIIAYHSGKDYDQVWKDSDRDYWMTAAEAKEYGMIDQVLGRDQRK